MQQPVQPDTGSIVVTRGIHNRLQELAQYGLYYNDRLLAMKR